MTGGRVPAASRVNEPQTLGILATMEATSVTEPTKNSMLELGIFKRGHVYTVFKLGLYKEINRLTLRSANRVVSICQAFAPRVFAHGIKPERIRILHNAAIPTSPVTNEECAQLRDSLGRTEALRCVC